MEKTLQILEKLTDDELVEIINIINSYDGSFENLSFFYNDDEFLENFFKTKEDAVRAFLYGDGIRAYNSDYVKFNAYGNVEAVYIGNLAKEIREDYLYDIASWLTGNTGYISIGADFDDKNENAC